jgi:hypothetical protein
MEPSESWERDEQNPYVRGKLFFGIVSNVKIEFFL